MAHGNIFWLLADWILWPLTLLVWVAFAIATILVIVGGLGGCAQPAIISQPVTVKVPVAVRAKVPAELRQGIVVDALPEFIEPGTKEASVALSPAGVQRLQSLLWALRSRISQWEAFGQVERKPPR